MRVHGGERLGAEVHAVRVRPDGHEPREHEAGRVELIKRGTVLIAHPDVAVRGAHETLEVAAERIKRKRVTKEIARLLVGVGEARTECVDVGKARHRRAIGLAKQDLPRKRERIRRWVVGEGADARLKVRQRERTLERRIRVDIERLEIWTAIGVRPEIDHARRRIDRVDPEATEAAEQNVLSRSGGAEDWGILQGRGGDARRAAAMILVAKRTDADDRLGDEVDHRHRAVLLERDPSRQAVGAHGDILRLEVLADVRAAKSKGNDRRIDDAGWKSVESDRRHVRLGDGLAADVNHADGSLGINRVSRVGLALVGGDHMPCVRREADHVGQCANLHGRHERAVRSEEHGLARIRDRHRGNRGDKQSVLHRQALDATAVRKHSDGASGNRRVRRGQVKDIDGSSQAVDDERAARSGIERDNLRSADVVASTRCRGEMGHADERITSKRCGRDDRRDSERNTRMEHGAS